MNTHKKNRTKCIVNTFIAFMMAFVCIAAQAADTDADGFDDNVDNCINVANGVAETNQFDADADGFGNICDADINNDGIVGAPDMSVIFSCSNTAPGDSGPADDPHCRESDLDGNGVVDANDVTIASAQLTSTPGPSGLSCVGTTPCYCGNATAPCLDIDTTADTDGDSVTNLADNCVLVPNFFASIPIHDPMSNQQRDNDFDGIGNACDGDLNNDGVVDKDTMNPVGTDFEIFDACMGQFVPGNGHPNPLHGSIIGEPLYHDPSCFESDMDASGFVDQKDLDLFIASLAAGVPGPSGLDCADAEAELPLLHCGDYDFTSQNDPFYLPILENPRYAPGTGPVVKIDSKHHNVHKINTTYKSFARLLEADGYQIFDFDKCWNCPDNSNQEYLEELFATDILVIANAQEPSYPEPTMSEQEAAILRAWVDGSLDEWLQCFGGCKPRNLLLIADHAPLPSFIENLSNELDLYWPNNNSSDNIIYKAEPAAGNPNAEGFLIVDHPIAEGRDGMNEQVESVSTFSGSVLIGNTPEIIQGQVLVLNEGATWTAGSFINEIVAPAGGWSQGIAFHVGIGRVYASGEAAMFSAQAAGGQFGMHISPRNQNQQYLVNVMHWLDGTLDTDGDGIGNAHDNCSEVPNPDQRDDDEDGYGNICDWDVSQDCITGAPDISLVSSHYFAVPPWSPIGVGAYDVDESNAVGAADVSAIFAKLMSPPGPSGRACAECSATPPTVAGEGACP